MPASIAPLFGPGFKAPTPSASVLGLQNMYYRPNMDKGGLTIAGTPGLRLVTNILLADGQSLPSRGALAVNRNGVDYIYSVHGAYLVEIATDGSYRIIPGTLSSTSGNVFLAWNGTDLAFVDGNKLYYYGSVNSVTQSTAAWVPANPTTIGFYVQRFVVSAGGTGKFYWSDLLAMTGDALNFATAENDTDQLLGLHVDHGILYLFGTRTVEFWNVTDAPLVYAAVTGATIEWGLASTGSISKFADGLIGLMRNARGEVDIRYIQGYQSTSVADANLLNDLNQQTDLAGAQGFAYFMDGSPRYELNVGGKTYLFDGQTKNWSTLTTGTAGARHRANKRAGAISQPFVFDYSNGKMYLLDTEQYTDNGETIIRRVQTKHLYHDLNLITVDEFVVDLESGVGLTDGQGSAPQIGLRVSKDNGHTWNAQRWRDMGALGKYLNRVFWQRLGRARDFVFQLEVSDPVLVSINAMAVRIRP